MFSLSLSLNQSPKLDDNRFAILSLDLDLDLIPNEAFGFGDINGTATTTVPLTDSTILSDALTTLPAM